MKREWSFQGNNISDSGTPSWWYFKFELSQMKAVVKTWILDWSTLSLNHKSSFSSTFEKMAYHFRRAISFFFFFKVFWNTVRYEWYWFMTRKTFVWINVKCDLPEIGFAHNSRIPKSFYRRSKNLHDCVFVFCYQIPEKIQTNALWDFKHDNYYWIHDLPLT